MGERKQDKKNKFGSNIFLGGVSITQKLIFARHLAVMLRSGLSISESLNIIYDQASGKFKKIIQNIAQAVQSGNSLSSALKNYPKVFSGLFISSAYAGEASGNLENNLNNIAEQLEAERELKSKIKGAMVYPVIVLIAALFLGIGMAFLVLPKITPLFEGLDITLPLSTKILILFSNTIQTHGRIIFIGLVFFIISFFWLISRKFFKPISHYIILKTPIINKISKNVNLTNFSKNLAILLKSGLPIDQALKIAKDTVANYYYKKCLDSISQKIGQGSRLSDNLSRYDNYFPKLVISMVSVGERSGNLEESLFYLADFYEIEVDNATKSLSTAIEPIMLIAIGLIVGVMAVSIVTPIYQITGSIQG